MKELKFSDVFDILPKRKNQSHKGDYGTLTAVVGSTCYRGAAVLSSLGALRTGVGILRVASVEGVIQAVAAAAPEAVFMPLENVGDFDVSEMPKSSALLCGCGIGRAENAAKTVRSILKECNIPLVLDADGLNNITADMLAEASCDVIITPHIGEFSRLTGLSCEEISAYPERYVNEFSAKHNVTVVLKSHITFIASPGKETAVSRYGNPGLARGGSGDVLAGMIASFVAQGIKPYEASLLGVTLHGMSADRCAKRLSQQAMLPHDILTDLCEIFRERGR